MTTPSPINTLGVVTFGPCGENDLPLFCVNPGIPLRQALEHVSALLFCAKKLTLDAALEKDGERHAWASHYLCDMGKAVIDDVCLQAF